MPEHDNRAELKAVLAAARIQIDAAIRRIDGANDIELAGIAGAAHGLAAFVDFNKHCAIPVDAIETMMTETAAFVDFNKHCGALTRTTEVLDRLSGRERKT